MLFDVKAQKWTELTHTAAYYPTWSHDGKYVCFSSAAEGEPVFYRVQIKDHRLERVASLKEVKRATHGGPGSWTGLALDDSPPITALNDNLGKTSLAGQRKLTHSDPLPRLPHYCAPGGG